MVDIRENIKGICKEKGVKQEVIAKQMKITQGSFSQRLTRNDDIKYSFLLEIANILGVDIVDIIKYPVKYVPEVKSCANCQERDRIIENLNILLEQYKKRKGKL